MLLWQCLNPFIKEKSVLRKLWKKCAIIRQDFKIEKRGFIKEGYYADLVIVNSGLPWSVKKKRIYC
jgi:dihydroorotase